MIPPLVSGMGAKHGKNVAKYLTIDFDQIKKMVDAPKSLPKDFARWVIPSSLESRDFKLQREKGEFWLLWADLDHEPPPMDVVEALVQSLAGDYEIYSSRSATIDVPKCRILIPLAKALSGPDWAICQRLLNDRFQAMDITPDRTSQRTGQLCYLPNRGEHYESRSRRDGRFLDVMVEWRKDIERERKIEAQKAAKKLAEKLAREAARAAKTIDPKLNLIDAFNSKYEVEDILIEAGYDQEGDKFRHPASQSGSFSASIKDGRVYTFSSNDPLYSEEGAHDAFSAFQVLFAGGDQSKALRLAGDEWIKIDGKSWNEVKKAEQLRTDFDVGVYDALAQRIDSATERNELMIEIPNAINTAQGLNEVSRKELRKRLVQKSGISLTALEKDARAVKKIAAVMDSNHLPAAQEVVASFGAENLIWANHSFWVWDSVGVWREMDERVLKRRIHEVAGSQKLTALLVNSILDLVKTEVSRPGHRFNSTDKTSLAVANGVLTLADGHWAIREHRRDDYRTILLPVVYDPDASAPRFLQFLDEVFAGTSDQRERIQAVQQALGYTLIASCHLERFFMLIGAGANGKSVLLKVVEALVGESQVCAVQPSQFENRFQRAHLDGKLANIITEIAEGAQMADAQLKALVSGELTTAENKFKPPYSFAPVATHWYGTNHMPSTRDFSDALFRRAMIIEFPNRFMGEAQDVRLAEKLLAELSGILNFALDGLAELLETGQFVTPSSSKRATEEWRLEADQVAQFVAEKTRRVVDKFIAIDALYMEYRNWAQGVGIRLQVTKKTFSNRLERLGYAKARGSKGSRGFRDIEVVRTDASDYPDFLGHQDAETIDIDGEIRAMLS